MCVWVGGYSCHSECMEVRRELEGFFFHHVVCEIEPRCLGMVVGSFTWLTPPPPRGFIYLLCSYSIIKAIGYSRFLPYFLLSHQAFLEKNLHQCVGVVCWVTFSVICGPPEYGDLWFLAKKITWVIFKPWLIKCKLETAQTNKQLRWDKR